MSTYMLKKASAAIALCAALTVPMATAGVAYAQDTGTGNTPSISSLIDSNRTTGTITIESTYGQPDGQNNDGSPKTVAGDAQKNYVIYKIGDLDPKKAEDWKTYAALNSKSYTQGATTLGGQTLGAPTPYQHNGGDGTELPLGFYLVVDQSDKSGESTVAPFKVSLPMNSPTDDSWNYDVHVYPKVQRVAVDKSVQDEYKMAGQQFTYTLSGDVINIPQGETQYSRYVMVDRPPLHVNLDQAGITGKIGNTDLDAADFTVEDGAESRDVKISLTRSGLDKLKTAHAADPQVKVTYTVPATTSEIPATNNDYPGGLDNIAYLYVDNGLGDPDNVNTEKDIQDSAATYYGQATLTKYADGTDTVLPGASFDMYRCEEGSAGTNSPKIISEKLNINGQTNWTTNDQGQIVLTGLQYEDARNGFEAEDTFDYCAVETKAPEGYVLNPNPIAFEVNSGKVLTNVRIDNVADDSSTELPFTGGQGIAMAVLGALLLALAAIASMMYNRKNA